MSRSLNNDHATKAWEDAYAYKAQIERREMERAAGRKIDWLMSTPDGHMAATLVIAFLMGCTLGGLFS